MNAPKTSLAYLGAPEQIHNCGSAGSSRLRINCGQVYEALLKLFDHVCSALQGRTYDERALAAAEGGTTAVIEAAKHRLLSLDPFQRPTNSQGFNRLCSLLTRFFDGEAGSEALICKAAVREEVDGPYQKLREEIKRAAACRPLDVKTELVPQIRKNHQVAKRQLVSGFGSALAHARAMCQVLTDIEARRNELPPTEFPDVQKALHEATWQSLTRAIAALGTELAGVEIARVETYLDDLCKQLEYECDQLRARLQWILAYLQKKTQIVYADTTFDVIADGPTLEEAEASFQAAFGASTPSELRTLIPEAYRKAFVARAAQRFAKLNEKSDIAEFLAAMRPEEAATAFIETVMHGFKYSYWKLLARHGVERAAKGMFAKAEPTVNLGGKADLQHGVEAYTFCICFLPTAAGKEEQHIAQEFRDELSRVCSLATFPDAPADAEVQVTRVYAGYPAALDTTSQLRARACVAAVEHNARPHLIGVVPDSVDGLPSPALTAAVKAW
ncbi:MAG: hypothetical protein NTW87_11905 [Planctomycetota bacterium]|nr:hypothetical protein [Planctomycetota bacterium]